MPRRPSRSSPRSRDGNLQILRRRVVGILRDLAIGLALVCVVSYLPGSVTGGWSSEAQRAVAISRDIRVLAGDVAWDLVVATGRLLWDLGVVLVSQLQSLPTLVPVPSQDRAPASPHTRWGPAPQGSAPAPDASALPRVAERFDAAERLLYTRVYADHRVTFYCGCDYDGDRQVELIGCDLHNLVPAVGLIIGKRADFHWGMVSGGERFGDCGIRIDAGIPRA
jgi:deoxyribonuclease I